ncbi:MAG: phosphoribosylamine--glycine ligase [Alphaproteobacteria bacterium]|nr:MAG: phosphoribosylamine--glycine ligase [Alphaproteobacteria bacterium]TAF13700.1 MAG: phosphoribosylamine--glycine ligase [Alphaproteobacteria bacterium]TAF38344.1 MAG: phosphoribosylamine--glycine ligase [Alphaproteobacteria bacterium]TAF76261.1 MAG: phosphoribosylamine--glycine ligase [Alphaproteobacteria bacterium]
MSKNISKPSSLDLAILVLGNGGREHAMVKALARSPHCAALFCSSGNGGIADDAECVILPTAQDVIDFCDEEDIDLVIIGPEQPLVDGVSDMLRREGILVFAPSQAAAQLEASKSFTKSICDAANIPTASYGSFTDRDAALAYLATQSLPIVIKADGLAAGKGVIIALTMDEATSTIHAMFDGQFGAASSTVVIESFLEGEEISFFALCDGTRCVPFGSAQDHKRAYDGDEGPNTGGMGTYAPAPIMNVELERIIMNEIMQPAVDEMAKRGTPYQGILFAGLMIQHNRPMLIEFNARLGDPETQVLLTRLTTDFAALCYHAALGTLPDQPMQWDERAAVCVVMASKGYPNHYSKGTEIHNLEIAESMDDVVVYHAGTEVTEDGRLIAIGGRVLGITALGATVLEAQQRAYAAVDTIDWKEGFCRRDIAWRAIARD